MASYFGPELFRFLARLKRNNNREWFQSHKVEYENYVRQPALRFITDFAGPLYEITPYLVADPRPSRGSLFRIYRDTRFSHDKRPYKTHVAMRFSHRGKDVHSPGFAAGGMATRAKTAELGRCEQALASAARIPCRSRIRGGPEAARSGDCGRVF